MCKKNENYNMHYYKSNNFLVILIFYKNIPNVTLKHGVFFVKFYNCLLIIHYFDSKDGFKKLLFFVAMTDF